MRRHPAIPPVLCIAVVTANSAFASFVGITVEDATDNMLDLKEYAIYATFDDPSDFLLGVSKCDITSTTSFYHSTLNGMKSALPWTAQENAQTNTPDVDSFVTIGLATGDDNQALLWPTFDLDGFLNGNSFSGAGWVLQAGEFTQGAPDANGNVLLAVFAPTNANNGSVGIVSGSMTIGYTSGSGLILQEAVFTTVPAPAPLLALTFLGAPRRRRLT